MLEFVNSFVKKVLLISLLFSYTVVYAKSTRDLYVISDLHMGIGKVDDKSKEWKDREWDKLEDFRWHDEFDTFIETIIKESKSNTDLVIAGDLFELWQGKDNLCDHPENKDLGCSEKEALQRIQRVIVEHKQAFDSLNKFVSKKGNRLTIIPGNHDAALLFPSVAKIVLDQFKNNIKNVNILKIGYWLNEDGKVLVDHGHQVEYDVNKFKNWPNPFIDFNGTRYLRKTAGEQLVQKLFNDMEDDIPLIDNLSSEWEGFKYAIEAGRWENIGNALSSGVGFLFNHMSWEQGTTILEGGDEKIPDVNVSAVKKNEGTSFFYNAFEENSPLYKNTKKLVEDQRINVEKLSTLTDETIKKICNYRQQLHYEQKKNNLPISIHPCNDSPKNDSLGAIVHAIFGDTKEVKMAKYIKELETNLREQNKTKGLKTYIYGHTHKYEKYESGVMHILNSGAWQRVVTVDKLKEIAEKKVIKDIFNLTLEDIPACYTYIVVKKYDKPRNMNVQLETWGTGCSNWDN